MPVDRPADVVEQLSGATVIEVQAVIGGFACRVGRNAALHLYQLGPRVLIVQA
ncbi:MAG: hypothetical protein ACQEW0_16260 [Pseudomonadota bacterium]